MVAVALIRNLGSNGGSGSADREFRIQQQIALWSWRFCSLSVFLYILPSLFLSIRVLVMFVFFLYRFFSAFFLSASLSFNLHFL